MARAWKLNPSRLSREFLEQRGWMVAEVEARIRPHVTRDLWGFADLCCVSQTGYTLWLQVTDVSNMSKRVQKVLQNDSAADLLARGHAVGVWGWYPEADRVRQIPVQHDRQGRITAGTPRVAYAEDRG